MTVRKGEGFPKAARIRRRREFLSIGRTGERRRTESFVVLLQPGIGCARLGVTVSRKVGGAVVRNLVKRRIRETFRRHPERAALRDDVIVIAKAGIGAPSLAAIRRDFALAVGRPARPRRSTPEPR
jgi:ribonuclease P protein component